MGNDSVEKCEMTLGFNLKKKKKLLKLHMQSHE